MKKIASILLIAAFLIQGTSQFWIWTVFKLNQNYIASTLCINRFEAIPVCKGSCVLENKINESNKQQEKLPDLKTKDVNPFCQHSSLTIPPLNYSIDEKLVYPNYDVDFISSEYLLSIFRPPSSFTV